MELRQEQEPETSAEAWATLAGLLDHGPVAVVWHNGRGCVREDFDTILERKGDVIYCRTYQQGKITTAGGRVKPGRLCWNDTWTRERSSLTHWPFLDTVLDYLQTAQGVTA
jgi:hypothetical protein